MSQLEVSSLKVEPYRILALPPTSRIRLTVKAVTIRRHKDELEGSEQWAWVARTDIRNDRARSETEQASKFNA